MKKIYSLALIPLSITLLPGCSKDLFRDYENRIEGAWFLTDVDRIGFGSSSLPFQDGRFVFNTGGNLEYTGSSGALYQGSWDIRRHVVPGNCSTNSNGNRECDDRTVRSLKVTAIDFQTRDVRTEYFDEIVFTGTNRFKAYVYMGSRTYVFKFRRE